jgi:hypothetical protein
MATAAVAGGTALLPKELFSSVAQDVVVNTVKSGVKTISREKVNWKLRPFPMTQVRLGDGPCKQAMEADRQYLH